MTDDKSPVQYVLLPIAKEMLSRGTLRRPRVRNSRSPERPETVPPRFVHRRAHTELRLTIAGLRYGSLSPRCRQGRGSAIVDLMQLSVYGFPLLSNGHH